MQRFYAVLAVVWTVLLLALVSELNSLNRYLGNRGGFFSVLMAPPRAAVRAAVLPETTEERRERNYQEMKRTSDDLKWMLDRMSNEPRAKRATPQSTP